MNSKIEKRSSTAVIAVNSDQHTQNFKRLMFFVAILAMTEGLSQHGALIGQPLKNYMHSVWHWNADMIAWFFAIWTLPWNIKPAWGLIPGKFPLFGYRRRSYLFVANALAVIGFGFMTVLIEPGPILIAMMLTTIGMAAASTLGGGVLVENGQRKGLCGVLVNQQWLWCSAAGIISSLLGGWLCDKLSAPLALHTAALIVVFPPMVVMLTCSFLLAEKRVKSEKKPPSVWRWICTHVLPAFTSWTAFGAGIKWIWRNVTTHPLSLIILFYFCYNFSPSFGTPLYTYQTDTLHFSQKFIGYLGVVGAVGSVVATLIGFWIFKKKLSLKTMLYLCIVLGTIAQGAYLWQSGVTLGWVKIDCQTMNQILSFVNGMIGMWGMVVGGTVCARCCPKHFEGFTYAIMASVFNIAGSLSDVTGSWMSVHWFNNSLQPLILVSCAFTLIPLSLVAALKIGKEEVRTIG
jgi:hypothetical protein